MGEPLDKVMTMILFGAVKKGALQAKNFSAASLKNYLDRLIQLDFGNKTGKGDIKTELTLLISGL